MLDDIGKAAFSGLGIVVLKLTFGRRRSDSGHHYEPFGGGGKETFRVCFEGAEAANRGMTAGWGRRWGRTNPKGLGPRLETTAQDLEGLGGVGAMPLCRPSRCCG